MTSCTLGVAVVKSDFVVNATERRTNESGVSTFEMLQIMVELLCGDQIDMREEEWSIAQKGNVYIVRCPK